MSRVRSTCVIQRVLLDLHSPFLLLLTSGVSAVEDDAVHLLPVVLFLEIYLLIEPVEFLLQLLYVDLLELYFAFELLVFGEELLVFEGELLLLSLQLCDLLLQTAVFVVAVGLCLLDLVQQVLISADQLLSGLL